MLILILTTLTDRVKETVYCKPRLDMLLMKMSHLGLHYLLFHHFSADTRVILKISQTSIF